MWESPPFFFGEAVMPHLYKFGEAELLEIDGEDPHDCAIQMGL